MGTGEGLVGTDDQLFRLADPADLRCQCFSLFGAVTVGDGHPAVLGIHCPGAVELYDGIDGLFPATALFQRNDMAGGIAPQQRLDIQHRADGGGSTADPACPFEKIQIVNGEDL